MDWGRYGEVYDYNFHTGMLNLPEIDYIELRSRRVSPLLAFPLQRLHVTQAKTLNLVLAYCKITILAAG
ncbi:hypothetical protein C1H71_00805 [Iodobacter fluviatilis]|uniref:Uncharacterized protein n=1 Tax=Iodobacter fluviatilis TaxID=537 RepID=A0A7G3G521_9NEIS|nr:hypothetical protein C1H71_00805 [Iodobacter fluviatilis]